jgi:hypothetical protein
MSWSSYAIKENGRWIGIAKINGLPVVIGSYKSKHSAEKYADQYIRQQLGEGSKKELACDNDRRILAPTSPHHKPSGGSQKAGWNGESDDYKPVGKSYWHGEVYIDEYGWAWGTEVSEMGPVGGKKCWKTWPLCLGTASDVVPILKGNEPIPEEMHPRRKALLELILERMQDVQP